MVCLRLAPESLASSSLLYPRSCRAGMGLELDLKRGWPGFGVTVREEPRRLWCLQQAAGTEHQ